MKILIICFPFDFEILFLHRGKSFLKCFELTVKKEKEEEEEKKKLHWHARTKVKVGGQGYKQSWSSGVHHDLKNQYTKHEHYYYSSYSLRGMNWSPGVDSKLGLL